MRINLCLNTIQYNTIQYNTIQYNTIQYNTYSLLYVTFFLKKANRYFYFQNISIIIILIILMINHRKSVEDQFCEGLQDPKQSTKKNVKHKKHKNKKEKICKK